MNRAELEHVIKAAADITGDEIVVIGSQAVLGSFPDAPETMLRSMEADLYPRNDPSRAIEIDGAIGDGSQFHAAYGYYAHGVGPETPHAPAGWEGRMLELKLPPMRPKGEPITAWFPMQYPPSLRQEPSRGCCVSDLGAGRLDGMTPAKQDGRLEALGRRRPRRGCS